VVALVGIHWLLGVLAFHVNWFGTLVKDSSLLLIEEMPSWKGGSHERLRCARRHDDASRVAQKYAAERCSRRTD
jgi:hypothetical protein